MTAVYAGIGMALGIVLKTLFQEVVIGKWLKGLPDSRIKRLLLFRIR